MPKDEWSRNSCPAGLAGAFWADYRFHKRWAVSLDVLYARTGGRIDQVLYPLDANRTKPLGVKLDYLQFPVLLNFYLTRSLAIKTGLQPSFLLHNEGRYLDEHVQGPLGISSTDWIIPIGLSYELNCGVILDARYNAGIKYSANPCDFLSRTVAFTFSVGCRFRQSL